MSSDILARVIAIGEALDDGDPDYARDLVADLGRDLWPPAGQHACPDCGRRFQFPGELEAHELGAHSWRRAA